METRDEWNAPWAAHPGRRSDRLRDLLDLFLPGLKVLAVISGIAILIGIFCAALDGPVLVNRTEKSKVTRALGDIRHIADQVRLFAAEQARWPATIDELIHKPSDSKDWPRDGYLERAPLDPWGNLYILQRPGPPGHEFDVISWGSDGRPAGENYDSDLHYWADVAGGE